MRRTALIVPLLGIVLALPACTGVDGFLGNTFSSTDNPNKPIGDSLNMRRVQGMSASAEPLTAAPGNVWPRGIERLPTLQDIPSEGPVSQPPRQPRSSSVAPLAPAPQAALPLTPAPTGATQANAALDRPAQPVQRPVTALVSRQADRYQTVSTPSGTAILVPNGNGTTTLMRADGSMETVPASR